MEMRLPPDFKEFLNLLNSHQVEAKQANGRFKDLSDLENLP
jgi:hypothetical protein